MVSIFTDGCHKYDNKKAGWSFVVVEPCGKKTVMFGGANNTESHHVELLAIVKALEYANQATFDAIEVHTDCDHVCDGIIDELARNGWKRKSNRPIKHIDTYKQIYAMIKQMGVRVVRSVDKNNPHHRTAHTFALAAASVESCPEITI